MVLKAGGMSRSAQRFLASKALNPAWAAVASKEMKGADPNKLVWKTPEVRNLVFVCLCVFFVFFAPLCVVENRCHSVFRRSTAHFCLRRALR
jgi:hypothetical protein